MLKFIVLLRGINVSGQKKIPMAELRELLETSGFSDVRTYIQSGNVILNSEINSKSLLKSKIEEIIKDKYKFDVPVLVKSRKDLIDILNSNPFHKDKIEKSYYCLPYDTPNPDLVQNLKNIEILNEEIFVSDNCIYLYYKLGAGRAKASNNFIERKLKLTATSRNHRTMQKLLTLSAEN